MDLHHTLLAGRSVLKASILGDSTRERPSLANASLAGYSHNSIRAITKELTSNQTSEHPPCQQEVQAMAKRTRLAHEGSERHTFHQDEITMIQGALTMTTKNTADVYTPLRRVCSLTIASALTYDVTLFLILVLLVPLFFDVIVIFALFINIRCTRCQVTPSSMRRPW